MEKSGTKVDVDVSHTRCNLGKKCVVCGSPIVKNITLHRFPQDDSTRKIWYEFAKKYNDKFSPITSRICSQHFTPDSWVEVRKKIGEYGIGIRYDLKPDACPTLHNEKTVKEAQKVLESRNNLLSMIMTPKQEQPKEISARNISKTTLKASIESAKKIFESCIICGSPKRGVVVLHTLPNSIMLKMKWLDFIEKAIRKKVEIPLNKVRVCSQHFEASSYENVQSVMNTTGFGLKIMKMMKTDAVPSLIWIGGKDGKVRLMACQEDQDLSSAASKSGESMVMASEEADQGYLIQAREVQYIQESNPDLVQATRTNFEQLLNKSTQKLLGPMRIKQMYKLMSKCEKEEIEKIRSIRGDQNESPNLFVCYFHMCGEGFLSKQMLDEHKKVHLPFDNNYTCGICQANFHTYRTYDHHLISHFGMNRRLCAKCGQSMVSRADIHKHYQSAHNGEYLVKYEQVLTTSKKLKGMEWSLMEDLSQNDDFRIEIDIDQPLLNETSINDASDLKIEDFSSDCLGIIDKIADRLKNFKDNDPILKNYENFTVDKGPFLANPSVERSDIHFNSRKTKTKKTIVGKGGRRSKKKQHTFTQNETPSPSTSVANNINLNLEKYSQTKCNLKPFNIPSNLFMKQGYNKKKCLAIRLSKIDDIILSLKYSGRVMLIDKHPVTEFPEIEHKVVKTEIDSSEEYKYLTLTEQGFSENLYGFRSEDVKIDEPDMDLSENWTVVLNTDDTSGDDDEPVMIEEGVDTSAVDFYGGETDEKNDIVPEFKDSLMESPSRSSDAQCEPIGMIVNSRSITKKEFHDQETPSGSSSESIKHFSQVATNDSFSNTLSNFETSSIKIEPLDVDSPNEAKMNYLGWPNEYCIESLQSVKHEEEESTHLNQYYDGDRTFLNQIQPVPINNPHSNPIKKKRICGKRKRKSRLSLGKWFKRNKKILREKLRKKANEETTDVYFRSKGKTDLRDEPNVFISRDETNVSASDLNKDMSSMQCRLQKARSPIKFQNLNLFDGDVDPKLVEDEMKPIVKNLQQKLDIKKKQEEKATEQFFPSNFPNGPTEFTCVICMEGFHHELMLQEHRKYHSKLKPVICWICSSQFQNYHTYKTHLIQHIGKNTKICSLCGQRLPTARTFDGHMAIHRKLEEHERSQHREARADKKKGLKKQQEEVFDKETEQIKKEKVAVCKLKKETREEQKTVTETFTETQLISRTRGFTCELCCMVCANSEQLKKHLQSECYVVQQALRPLSRSQI